MNEQKVFPFRANLAKGGATSHQRSERTGWLTPYEVETLFADALWAGQGARLEVSVPARTSDAGLDAIRERFERPVLVVWADADAYMPVASARWLEAHVPGVERVVIVPGGKLFFPEEEHALLNRELRAFWSVER